MECHDDWRLALTPSASAGAFNGDDHHTMDFLEEQAARELERQRYRDLFDLVPVAILMTTPAGLIEQANRAAADLLAVPSNQLVGKLLGAFMMEQTAPVAIFTELSQLSEDAGRTREYDERLRAGGGTAVPALVTVSAVRGPAGEVAGLQWLVRERGEAESRRESSENTSRRELVAILRHELMNPLNGILLHAELLKWIGRYRDDSVDAIITLAHRQRRLIEDLLDLAWTDTGRLSLRPSRVNLLKLVRACTAIYRPIVSEHVLRIVAPARMPAGHWDRGRIQQVCHNLLENAVKYSPEGGEILVGVEDLGDHARVSVADHGVGIAADALPQVFDRFFRAHVDAGPGGLGLGLHVAKALVEAHGGTISAESEAGHGSVFRVTLPYASAAHNG